MKITLEMMKRMQSSDKEMEPDRAKKHTEADEDELDSIYFDDNYVSNSENMYADYDPVTYKNPYHKG